MTFTLTNHPLPVTDALPTLHRALAEGRNAVLEAPPGAGKTTLVPLALLDAPWLRGQTILMLEPRRLAARRSAVRMAEMIGEGVGETVGYRVRQDSKVSRHTRVEVVTEGILTRRLASDPDLAGVGLVIFDEFHERSLTSDLGLALCLEVQAALRDDLRLLVMSATLDGAAVAGLLNDCPVIRSEGRMFPVETRFLPGKSAQTLAAAMSSAIQTALDAETGSILAFLPGEGEIRQTQRLLGDLGPGVDIAPLYGALPAGVQDQAIRPSVPGRRKVVLATAIAETSLTIDGVRVVIDGGYSRRNRFDVRSGLDRLVTVRTTAAEAAQRCGRAGRLEPGVCYRLWSEAEDRALLPYPPPEISEADLAPLALDLAAWGASADSLAWLTPPPAASLAQARDLLQALGAVDAAGKITAHGKAMSTLPLHPRLAHMILAAKELGLGGLACVVAALLSERDVLRGVRDGDVRRRVEACLTGHDSDPAVDRGALASVRQLAGEWRRRLSLPAPSTSSQEAGLVVALAYPERVAKRRTQGGFVLVSGRGATLADSDPLAAEDFLAIADLEGGPSGKVWLAAPLTRADIDLLFADRQTTSDTVRWDNRSGSVQARRQTRLGALVLDDQPLPSVDPAHIAEGLLDGLREQGLGVLPWEKPSLQLRARLAFLRRAEGEPWPDVSDEALLEHLEDWLLPALSGMSKLSDLKKVALTDCLATLIPWELRQRLDREAPSHLEVASGSRIALDYENGDVPVLAVRVQELFGTTQHPLIAGGRTAVVIHLLSPAHRPIQITGDLPGFWRTSWSLVRSELRGRYPRHSWPEDPLASPPTTRAKPRGT